MKMTSIQNKDRILKAMRKKIKLHKQIWTSADFSTQTLNARWSWNNMYQALKENGCQPRILYPAKLNFRFEDEKKTSKVNKS